MAKFESESVGSVRLPDGIYTGTVSGKNVSIDRGQEIVSFEVKQSSYLISKPVQVSVKGMQAKVKQL